MAFEGRPIGAPDHDAAHVFAAAAGGGMSSRLFQEVREKRGLAYSIYAFHWDYSDAGLFGFYAGSADKDAAEVVAASLDCLAEAAQRLDDKEIRRAKAQMKVSILAALELSGARAQQTRPADADLRPSAVARRDDRPRGGDLRRRRSQNRRRHA